MKADRKLLVKLYDIVTDIDDHREGPEDFVSEILKAFGCDMSGPEILDILGDDYKPLED